jgi:hypothetical protein
MRSTLLDPSLAGPPHCTCGLYAPRDHGDDIDAPGREAATRMDNAACGTTSRARPCSIAHPSPVDGLL